MPTHKIAAVQTAPVFLDRDATIDKACRQIHEAAANGAQLILFPEAYVPAYPDWASVLPAGDYADWSALYGELVDQSVTVPSPATNRLCDAARRAGAYVAMGINERNMEASNGSLYNTLLYIDPEGAIMGKHRKLVPTGPERLIWAQGAGDTLDAYDTPLGKVSGLICWENYMPLARYTVYAWGTEIYLAPTWDRGDLWLATLRHIAREGRIYVVGCSMTLRMDDIPSHYSFKQNYGLTGNAWINAGDSAIVDPNGNFLAGPMHEAEGILYADIELQRVRSSRWMLDVAGHYARPDVFQLTVNTTSRPMIGGQPLPTPLHRPQNSQLDNETVTKDVSD